MNFKIFKKNRINQNIPNKLPMEKHEIAIIGLGKMGLNLALNLKDKGILVYGYTKGEDGRLQAEKEGIKVAKSIDDLMSFFEDRKKIFWIMVPQGNPVEEVLFDESEGIVKHLKSGDLVIDGGNSYFVDSVSRYTKLKELGIDFLDCGTSGGMLGARNGACLMIGGDQEVFNNQKWVFESIAAKDGYFYVGASGSGHYVKMIHNAIEYGMMQSIAEGLNLVKNGEYKDVDIKNLLSVWNHGSIVESYLTKITEEQMGKYSPNLDEIEGIVEDNGEGAWTLKEAVDKQIPFETVAHALFSRFSSRDKSLYQNKVLALMRNGFGGHRLIEEDNNKN